MKFTHRDHGMMNTNSLKKKSQKKTPIFFQEIESLILLM
jgi:hypothetical protein